MDTQIISLSNQKGGVGKTTTCANLGIGLAREGKRVLLVDCDPQASLTLSLGWRKLESLSVTLATLMGRVLQKQPVHAAKRRLPIRFSAECENWRVESKSFKKNLDKA